MTLPPPTLAYNLESLKTRPHAAPKPTTAGCYGLPPGSRQTSGR
jgi:hypothetical protein